MDRQTIQLVDALIYNLERHVVPEISGEAGRIYADLVIRGLGMLRNRHRSLAGHTATTLDRERELLERMAGVLRDPGAGGLAGQDLPQRLERAAELLDGEFTGDAQLAVLEGKRLETEEVITTLLPEVLGLSEYTAEGESLGDASECIRDLLNLQSDFLLAENPEMAGGAAQSYRGGRIDREGEIEPERKVAVDEEGLTRYLRRKFPEENTIHARSVRVLPGGFSKLTALFDMVRGDGRTEGLVMRKDILFSASPAHIVDEYPILEMMYAAGFPVAKPCWLERDAQYFNGAFLVSEQVAGSTDQTAWKDDPGAAAGFARQLAKIMAQLHRLDVKLLGFTREEITKSAGEHTLAMLETWRQHYLSIRKYPRPVLDLGYTWLMKNIPADLFDTPPLVVHGDIGFHNMLIMDGEVQALLDWEFCHLGDPMEDLNYVRQFVEQVFDWEQFLDMYQNDYGGLPYVPERDRFYTTWRSVRNATGCAGLVANFQDHDPTNLRAAIAGQSFAAGYEIDAIRQMLGAVDN